jgi:hypothetical protein
VFGPLVARLPPTNTSSFTCPSYGDGFVPVLDKSSIYSTKDDEPVLESINPIEGVKNHFQQNQNATGFSVSLWFTPAKPVDAKQARILTIGQRYATYNDTPGGCDGYDFQVRQNGNQIIVSWTDYSTRKGATWDACRTQFSTNWAGERGNTVEA